MLVSALSALAVVTLWVQSVAAVDLLIYYTPEGRRVLTNRPPPKNAKIIFGRPPSQSLPALSNANSPLEAQFLAREERAPVPINRTNGVDTVPLAQITRDMSMPDVRRLVGAPGRIVALDPTVRVSSDRSNATGGHLERSVWVYADNAQGSSTLVWFVNGRVARVKRVWGPAELTVQ
jgi:hypothetical protein